jgi:eight-cysteine-cluster-containing protein
MVRACYQWALTRSKRGHAVALLLWLPLLAGCQVNQKPLVNGFSSRPFEGSAESDPYRRLPDRTLVVAYEVGQCTTDADCVTEACGGATCAPANETPLCAASPVADCLSALDGRGCGCVEGVCRWHREPPVLACARRGSPPATTVGAEGYGDNPYPTRPQ